MTTKITDILGVIYRDLATVLQKMTPQALALSRHERSTPLLHLSAAEMLASPELAAECLGPEGTAALGRAVVALGEGHMSRGRRMIELAAQAKAPEPEVPR
jgi:hypothetical protein